jgi:uncharacterized surface anchored protein
MVLALMPALLISNPTRADAAWYGDIGSVTLGEAFGFDRLQFVSYLKSHENDGYFIGTPYSPGTGVDCWRPKGDPGVQAPYTPGMNCSGFVYYVLHWGFGMPFPGYWDNWMKSHDLTLYLYDTKEAMLADGRLQKGDVIWMFDVSAGDGFSHSANGYTSSFSWRTASSHVGIFWGDSPTDDKLWHSHSSGGSTPGNEIGPITPKAAGSTYAVMPIDEGGKIQVRKSSTTEGIIGANNLYKLAGAQFTVHDSVADANSWSDVKTTLVTDAAGTSNISGNLPFGTYYVRERVAPSGFLLNTTNHVVVISDATLNSSRVAFADVSDVPYGQIELHKSSLYPEMTEGNKLYSLFGARYGIYSTWQDASNETNAKDTMTTGEEGQALSARLAFGTYYVRESAASTGYLIDNTIYTVTISSTSVNLVTGKVVLATEEKSIGDPVAIWLYKTDADTETSFEDNLGGSRKNLPQNAATLKGARFVVEYYDWLGDLQTGGADNTPITDKDGLEAVAGTALKTWVFESDADGFVWMDESYLAPENNDDLYMREIAGKEVAIIPRGTFITWESIPPKGYLLPDPINYHIAQYDTDALGEVIREYNASTQKEAVIRGDIALTKSYVTDDAVSGQLRPEPNITFDFYAERHYEKTDAGKYVPKPEALVAFSIKTDDEGYADTRDLYVIDVFGTDGIYTSKERTDTDAGGVPFGQWLCVQRNAAEVDGKPTSKAEPFVVTVDVNAKTHHYNIANSSNGMLVSVIKRDAETKMKIPYPATWSVRDMRTGNLVQMLDDRTTNTYTDRWTSNAEGDITFNDKLPLGSYELIEISAPFADGRGYLLNFVPLAFEITEYKAAPDALVLEFEDMPAKGKIKITKTDGGTKGGFVKGARYHIYADEDIVTLDGTIRVKGDTLVSDICTDSNGVATTDELYLGRYRIIEIETVEGWRLDQTVYRVNLTYLDQETAVVIKTLSIVEEPTLIELTKTDTTDTSSAVEGATYAITAKDLRSYDIVHVEKALDAAFVQLGDEQSTKDASIAYRYDKAEVASALATLDAKPGVANVAVERICRSGDGTEISDDIFTISLNEDKTVTISMSDKTLTSLAPLGEEPLKFEAVTDKSGKLVFEYIPQGDWTLREVASPAGYLINPAIHEFSVDKNGDISGISPDFVTSDEPLVLEVSKRAVTGSEELPGATLEIYQDDGSGKADGEVLYSWVSTDEPHFISAIPEGNYILRETIAPDGYLLADDVAFAIEPTGEVQGVVMYDDVTKLDVSKKDITSKEELPGATLEIYKDNGTGEVDGEALYSWVSSDEPHRITGIKPGNYLLRETIAPGGYLLASDMRFSIKPTGEVQTVVMFDERAPAAPGKGWDKTGVDLFGNLLLIFVVCVIVGGAGATYCVRKIRLKRTLLANEVDKTDSSDT